MQVPQKIKNKTTSGYQYQPINKFTISKPNLVAVLFTAANQGNNLNACQQMIHSQGVFKKFIKGVGVQPSG